MNKPQFIKTPNGEDLVILSRADYEALTQAAAEAEEEAADIAIYDARKADRAGSEPLPAEVSRAMLGGASLLKALRLWRDVGQVKLASDIGVLSQGYISDLESGRRQMTGEIARRIATALDVPESWLR